MRSAARMWSAAQRAAARWAAWPRLVRWALPLCWAGLIWWLSSRTLGAPARGLGLVFVFNGAHVVVFGALAALLHLASARRGAARVWFACLLAAAYGAVDEVHQSFVPGRQPSVFDWLSDASGALLAAAALAWLREGLPWARRTALAAVPLALAAVTCATVW